MVRSLAVVLVVVGVIVALNIAEQPDPVPDGWRVASARTEPDGAGVAWHVGLVTRRGEYAAVEQTDGDRRTFVDRFVPGSRADGRQRVAGRTWTRRVGGTTDARALVLEVGGVTTLVTGSASWAELAELARSL